MWHMHTLHNWWDENNTYFTLQDYRKLRDRASNMDLISMPRNVRILNMGYIPEVYIINTIECAASLLTHHADALAYDVSLHVCLSHLTYVPRSQQAAYHSHLFRKSFPSVSPGTNAKRLSSYHQRRSRILRSVAFITFYIRLFVNKVTRKSQSQDQKKINKVEFPSFPQGVSLWRTS